MHSKYYIPACSATPPYTVDVTPESAGWTESSLQVVELESLRELTLDTGDTEVMILPLSGDGTVECRQRDLRTVSARIGFRRSCRHGLHRHRPGLHPAR